MAWRSLPTPLILGHRGASAYAPENTLAAFELALEQGAHGIEFDVHLSKDGWPVVIHDDTVDRTTNGTGAVSSLTVAELQALDVGQGEGVPTLDDVLATLGQRCIYNVEIKGGRGIEAAVADRIQSHQVERQTIVSSFDRLVVRRARRHLSLSTPVALLQYGRWDKLSYWIAGGDAAHPHYPLVNEAFMSWARQKGYRVHVWTVDDPTEARRLANLGVHAIITNQPDTIREALHG